MKGQKASTAEANLFRDLPNESRIGSSGTVERPVLQPEKLHVYLEWEGEESKADDCTRTLSLLRDRHRGDEKPERREEASDAIGGR